jgi:magnesium-transporting ATPase (P-type)
MYGCFSAWTAGGWYLGMPLTETSTFYTSGVYAKGVTMTFAGIVMGQVGNVLACRTSKQSMFKASLAKNKWILLGIFSQISILSLLVYVPLMQGWFGTTALGIMDWAYLLLISLSVIFAEEIRKLFVRRFFAKTTEDLAEHDHT